MLIQFSNNFLKRLKLKNVTKPIINLDAIEHRRSLLMEHTMCLAEIRNVDGSLGSQVLIDSSYGHESLSRLRWRLED